MVCMFSRELEQTHIVSYNNHRLTIRILHSTATSIKYDNFIDGKHIIGAHMLLFMVFHAVDSKRLHKLYTTQNTHMLDAVNHWKNKILCRLCIVVFISTLVHFGKLLAVSFYHKHSFSVNNFYFDFSH